LAVVLVIIVVVILTALFDFTTAFTTQPTR